MARRVAKVSEEIVAIIMKRPFPKTQRKQPSSAYRCLLVVRKFSR